MNSRYALDMLCINTIRTLSIDAVQKANSGHPGLPLGAAPMAYVLWDRHLRHNPSNPKWADRDRFVLSAGHGSALLYSLLHLSGYELSLTDLKNFRQWESPTPGHPESFMTPGVEATTGPLGQGTANAVGMAIAERALAHRFNRPGYELVNHFTYALVGDGDLMEGISAEAASLAGHLKLGKLIYLYDANEISLDGPISLAFTEDVGKRYEACGWQVLYVADGNDDLDGIDAAIRAAKAETGKPSLIIIRTTIGFGSPNKQGTAGAHGSPLGKDEIALTKKALGWNETEAFVVPSEARAHFEERREAGAHEQRSWDDLFAAYSAAFPELAGEWRQAWAGELPEGWAQAMPKWKAGEGIATRVSSGSVLNAIAAKVSWFLGGDADLSSSTKTNIKGEPDFCGQSGQGRNLRYGVREHAMGAIANGIAYHGGLRTYTATFFCFADYMRPAMRLAALSRLPVVFVFTHDSIGLGEDGPTHQPVEHLASLRCMPNMRVIRPADAHETEEAWKSALLHTSGPTTLVLSRQNLPTLDQGRYGLATGLHQGGYVLAEAGKGEPEILLLATGSEVPLALEARERLEAMGKATRVVSMPCWELFAAQDQAYRHSVIPPQLSKRVAIEAGVSFGWARWLGDSGKTVCVDEFGASAPDQVIFEKYGFTVDHIVEVASNW